MLQLLRQSSIVYFCLLLFLLTACVSFIAGSKEPLVSENSPSSTLTLPVDKATRTETPSVLPSPAATRPLRERVAEQDIILYTRREGAKPLPLLSQPQLPLLNQSPFSTLYGKDFGYLYADDYAPQLNAGGRTLMVPGIKWPGPDAAASPDDAHTWLVDFTTGNVQELAPRTPSAVWSPNGQQLAYVSEETLYLQEVDAGGDSVPVFTEPGLGGFFLDWSPDGQQIAVVSTAVGESIAGAYPPITDTLWLVPAEGDTLQSLGTFSPAPIEHSRHELQWSADGSALLVGMSQPNLIFTLDGQQSALEEGVMALTWIPQQFQLLVREKGGGLSLMDAQNQERIVAITDSEFRVTDWSFSGDGRYLAYSTEREAEKPVELAVFDLAQRTTRVLGPVAAPSIGSLHWTSTNDILIFDGGDHPTPIWALSLEPGSIPEELVEQGRLINVICPPSTP